MEVENREIVALSTVEGEDVARDEEKQLSPVGDLVTDKIKDKNDIIQNETADQATTDGNANKQSDSSEKPGDVGDKDHQAGSPGKEGHELTTGGANISDVDGKFDESQTKAFPPSPDAKQVHDSDEVEDNQSSNSSSPSALHIHLDEEKEESASAEVKETKEINDPADPSLPLICNVVSLSESDANFSVPEAEEATSAAENAEDNANLNSANSANNTRRATLRLKRGIEISFDVDQNGQPIPVMDPSGSNPAHSDQPTNNSKRPRYDDDETTGSDSISLATDVSDMDPEGIATILAKVQKDIRTLRFMAKQKEKEWNYILKLMKVKEELQAKLMRRREVLKIGSAKRISPPPSLLQEHHRLVAGSSAMSAASMTATGSSAAASANLQSISQTPVGIAPPNKGYPSNSGPKINANVPSSHSVTVVNPQKNMHRQRPILPKPVQMNQDLQLWNASSSIQNHMHDTAIESLHTSSQQEREGRLRQGTVNVQSIIADFRAGVEAQVQDRDARNRQGTINVQSFIADYRAKHPEEIPTRGRRVRQSSKIGDPASSNSPTPPPPPPATSHMGPTDTSSMSFKDVLLQFAKMSSRHGHSSTDLMQLGSKESGNSSILANSHSLLSSGSGPSSTISSTAALQSLAARSARANPTNPPSSSGTSGISAGSILQNALSGTVGGRGNPSFAPTLAQLLTNPAAEQQQQQPQPAQQQPQTQQLNANSSGPLSAEVLTLSNLLATAKGSTSTARSGSTNSNLSNPNHNSPLVAAPGGTNSTNHRPNNSNTSSSSNSSATNGEVPKCQGCNERVAQFVCAGCSSQWYCSRECQVAAWEEHSENCVG